MNYQILASKYRPQSFKEVIGQKHIITAISNSIDLGRIHHSWLLSGTRGIGKTTIGRLLAKSLNCKEKINSIPCRTCVICKEIEKGTCLDFIEIDAASKTKVEEIKEILDNIYYAPIKSRFKIYLIDEVHMLSKHSFNALLKTLEEPPNHIKFILATTNVEKIPKTIISRCLYFKLNILSEKNILNFLEFILNKENINFNQDALKIISYYAKGSMRDALNLLEHAISFSKNNINLKNVNNMLGIPSEKNIYLLTKFLLEKDSKNMMFLLNKISKINIEWENILIEMLRILHHIAMIKLYPLEWNEIISKNYQDKIHKIANKHTKQNIQTCYKILLNGRKELIFSPNHKIGVEITLLQAIMELENEKNMFSKNGLGNLMKQAQQMQEKMAKIQEEISKMEVTGEAGAGLVKVTINGAHNCRRVEIDPSLLKDDDKDMLEDLAAAAFNDATRRISEVQKKKMSAISTGMQLPSGFNMPI